jgi:hypothetical protein
MSTWTKISGDLFYNELAEVSKDGKLLHVVSLTTCATRLSDGYLSPASLRIAAALVDVPPETARELVAAGLWEECPDGAYYLPTYLRDNLSAEEAARYRANNAKRQRDFRARQRADARVAQAQHAVEVNAARNGVTNAASGATGNAVTNDAPVPVSRPRLPGPVAREVGADAPAPAARPRPTTARIPASAHEAAPTSPRPVTEAQPDVPPIEALVALVEPWASERGIPARRLSDEAERFRHFCLAGKEGRPIRYADYGAAFKYWLTNPLYQRVGTAGAGPRRRSGSEAAKEALRLLREGPPREGAPIYNAEFTIDTDNDIDKGA